MFAVGCSIIGRVICKVVCAINVVYRDIICWPQNKDMHCVMLEFKQWCGMPSVYGAIDYTYIAISKLSLFPEDYYYFKTGSYSMVAQSVVDCHKWFIDIFVGLPSSVNDQRILRRFSLYRQVRQHILIHVDRGSQNGICPYLLGDKGNLLLDWMLVPYEDDGHERSVLEALFNKSHRRGRSVVENAFGLLKENWRILLNKCDLFVKIIPNVFVCCCIMHNLLLQREEVDVEELMRRMVIEFDNNMEIRHHEVQAAPAFNPNADIDFDVNLANGEVVGDLNRRGVEAFLGAQPHLAWSCFAFQNEKHVYKIRSFQSYTHLLLPFISFQIQMLLVLNYITKVPSE